MTITSTVRACDHCGESITVTSRNPNRRFCSLRCRRADWRHRHRAQATNCPRPSDDRGNTVSGDHDVSGDAVPHPKTTTRCPHCHQQVTVLLWMLPPAAAHVTPPRHA